MPDRFNRHGTPDDWHAAFAALPQETPPSGGWDAVAARLDARRRRRWPMWGAMAAALLLAVALPWRLPTPTDAPQSAAMPADVAIAAGDPALDALRTESAQLEALLPLIRDERVSSASAILVAAELDAQLAAIDIALDEPGLDHARELALWRERVAVLHEIADFEGTRRWLAANGGRYDPVFVHID